MLFEYYLWLYPVHFPSCSLCSLNKSLTFCSHTWQTHHWWVQFFLMLRHDSASSWLSQAGLCPSVQPRRLLTHQKRPTSWISPKYHHTLFIFFQKLKTSVIGEYEETCHMFYLYVVFISSLSKTWFSAILVTFTRQTGQIFIVLAFLSIGRSWSMSFLILQIPAGPRTNCDR